MRSFAPRLLALLALCLAGFTAQAIGQHYKSTDLTSDQSGMATNMDPHLVNPWGLSRGTSTPWWISDNGMGVSTLYDGTGAAKSLVVTVPTGDPTVSPTGTPTGTVVNIGTGFELAPKMPARFMWVTEDGTISGWNPAVNPTTAVIKVNTKGAAVFKGVAEATVKSYSGAEATFLYAADFRGGRVQVYDTNFHRVWLLGEAFRDDRIPHGYAPFNIQNIGGELYVAFARKDSARHAEVDGPGLGFVDVFSPTGFLLRRLQHGSWLNGPWALAMAPGDFGIYSHDLLVGQFGSGQIAVYDPVTGRFLDLLRDAANNPLTIGGLWALSFASGGTSGSATTLYFTAGADGGQHGLFGTITAVENPLGNSQ